MREYAEEEDEAAKGQYEFPEVEKSLPECIRETLTHNTDYRGKARRILREHSKGRYGAWIERLRRIQRFSRPHRTTLKEFERELCFDGPPLPSLLVAFKEHDAIMACFDEESQYMLEGNPEPALGVIFSPNNQDEVRQVILVVRRFVAINCELFLLAEQLVEWEKSCK